MITSLKIFKCSLQRTILKVRCIMWPFSRSSLPLPTGPYVPGCVDIMTEYSKTGSFFRLHYPTEYKGKIQAYTPRWIPWILHDSYTVGFARFTQFWLFVVRLTLWLVSGRLEVPIVHGAKIKNDKKLKCIVFSHGLGGTRFAYSSICNELASHGFLVAAVEHRDQSASNTYYYNSKDDAINDNRTYIDYSVVPFGDQHYGVRNTQVKQRADECTKVLNILHEINSGLIPHNVLQDVPTYDSGEFDMKDLRGLLNLDDVAMMGHSFGAATSLLTLAQNPKMSCGIILDIWMFPIKDMEELVKDVKQPLLFINTQTFHISKNIFLMEKFINVNAEERPCYTMLHTTHENQSDVIYASGSKLNLFMKKLTPETATQINNYLILIYLNKYTNFPKNIDVFDKYIKEESHNIVIGVEKLKQLSAEYVKI